MAGQLVALDGQILDYLKQSGVDTDAIKAEAKDRRAPAERFSAVMERHFSNLMIKSRSEQAQASILQEAMDQMIAEGADIGEMASVLEKLNDGFNFARVAATGTPEAPKPEPKPAPKPEPKPKAEPWKPTGSGPDGVYRPVPSRNRRAKREEKAKSGWGAGRIAIVAALGAAVVFGGIFATQTPSEGNGGLKDALAPVVSALSGKPDGYENVYMAYYFPAADGPLKLNARSTQEWGQGRLVHIAELYGDGGGCAKYGDYWFFVIEFSAEKRKQGEGPWSDEDIAKMVERRRFVAFETRFEAALAHFGDGGNGLRPPTGYHAWVYSDIDRAMRNSPDGLCKRDDGRLPVYTKAQTVQF